MGTMRELDQQVITDGRSKTLGESAIDQNGQAVEVKVPLREQVQSKLFDRLKEMKEGDRTVDLWQMGNAERSGWLTKQQGLLRTFDEFIEPIRESTTDWSSNLHLPTVYTACKTMHARFLAALMGIDPPFTVKARQAANVDRAQLIQELMRYTLSSWVNENKGVERELDNWLWRWVTAGSGILKSRWHRRFERYVDVVEEMVTTDYVSAPGEDGNTITIPIQEKIEREEEVLSEVFNGPVVEAIPVEDVLIIGGKGDPQAADDVIQSIYMTASELWSLADQKVFNREAVEKAINSGEDYVDAEQVNMLKSLMSNSSGTGNVANPTDSQKYQILERYARLDVDGSGIAAEVIIWVHVQTAQILRATYLRRVMKAGLRPFFKIDFHQREGQTYGVGLPELLFSIAEEVDAIHNLRMDFGTISSIPFGFYRASSSMKTEKFPLEPGTLIPLDNPQTDVYFPQIGNRSGFLQNEEQMLYQTMERMTSISDLSLGVIGGQGAARTATGARALLGESNANLDVYLRRMNRGWKSCIQYVFKMLQQRLPAGFTFRVLGDDGSEFFETIRTTAAVSGDYDFELEANSANSNKAIQIEQANNVVATIMNPLLFQLGVVSPIEVYNALKTKLQVEGIKDFSRYIRKPQGQMRLYTPEEIANSILAGVDVKLGPEQDLQGFIDYFNYVVDHDEILGQYNEAQTITLARKAQEAQAMMEAVAQQQAQLANQQQMSINASAASSPTPQGAGASAAQGAPPA